MQESEACACIRCMQAQQAQQQAQRPKPLQTPTEAGTTLQAKPDMWGAGGAWS